MRTSVIPAGVKLVGEVEGRGELSVAGVIEGPIALEGILTIEEGGEVRGDVSVTSLLVRGVLAGTASATDAIRVEASAIVVGDARAPRVQIVEGARFRGRVQMTGEAAQPVPRRRRTREEREERRFEPAEREARPAKPVREEARPAKPAREEVRAAKPAREEVRAAKPAREEARPAKPAREEARPAKPARDEVRPATPVREEARAAKPAREEAAAEEPPRKRRRGRRPPPPTIPGVQRQTARRKDGAPPSESI